MQRDQLENVEIFLVEGLRIPQSCSRRSRLWLRHQQKVISAAGQLLQSLHAQEGQQQLKTKKQHQKKKGQKLKFSPVYLLDQSTDSIQQNHESIQQELQVLLKPENVWLDEASAVQGRFLDVHLISPTKATDQKCPNKRKRQK